MISSSALKYLHTALSANVFATISPTINIILKIGRSTAKKNAIIIIKTIFTAKNASKSKIIFLTNVFGL